MPKRPSYSDLELTSLSDVEHARERPEMYLGTKDFSQAGTCLAQETFCLAIDEILSGRCTELKVGVADQRFHLTHNGNCPDTTTIQPDGKTVFESVLTMRGICRQLANEEYVAENICRLSIPTVVYLSKYFEINGFDGTSHYRLTFVQGVSADGLLLVGPTSNTGVSLSFLPDSEVLGETSFDLARLKTWFQQLPLPWDSFTVEWA